MIRSAEQVSQHVFDFLGTGPVEWGDSIDWHQDIRTGYCWLLEFYSQVSSTVSAPISADPKIPYELSRLHHFVTLGQAYWLTDDQRWSDEFFAQWESWLASNPWPYGINWTSAMEVAIRAVNLMWGCALVADAPGWTIERDAGLNHSLRQHGLYIERNLEIGVRDGQVIAANHYLANIVGLLCLGLLCSELPEADRWRRVGLRALEQEIQRQVLPDGFFFESSTSYHRLAVELFLIPALLARRCGHDMSNVYWQRLEQMLEVIVHITRPDGCVPQIGDNDDGRLLILSGYPDWPRHDHRYLLALGAVIFERGDFKAAALQYGPLPPNPPLPTLGEGGTRLPSPTSPPELVLSPVEGLGGTEGGRDCPEEVFWLLGREGVEQFDALDPDPTPLGCRAFAHGGLYLLRSQDNRDYALVRTSTDLRRDTETRRHGDTETTTTEQQSNIPPSPHLPISPSQMPTAHTHNDTLSLELWVSGEPVIVDPGTFCYTSDPEQRNHFRSTAAHNTVMVDGEEINDLAPSEIFWLGRDAQVRVNEWKASEDEVSLVVEHDGYARLIPPVTHRRTVRYGRHYREWEIADELVGGGPHLATWYWHFAPGCAVAAERNGSVIRVEAGAAVIRLAWHNAVLRQHRLEPSWHATAFGKREPAMMWQVNVGFFDRMLFIATVESRSYPDQVFPHGAFHRKESPPVVNYGK